MDAIDAELARAQEERRNAEDALAAGAPMAVSFVAFDTDLYGGGGADPDRFAGYDTSILASEDAAAAEEDDAAEAANPAPRRLSTYTGHAIAAADLPRSADGDDGLPKRSQRIVDREDDYRRRRLSQIISPERHDPFVAGEATPDPAVQTYADVMRDAALQKKKEDIMREIAEKKEEAEKRKWAICPRREWVSPECH